MNWFKLWFSIGGLMLFLWYRRPPRWWMRPPKWYPAQLYVSWDVAYWVGVRKLSQKELMGNYPG